MASRAAAREWRSRAMWLIAPAFLLGAASGWLAASPVWGGSPALPAGPLPLRMIVLRTESEARDVVAAVARGIPFERLVRERSIGPERERSGYLGRIDPATLSSAARAALVTTRRGRLSPIFPTEGGYAVLQVLPESIALELETSLRHAAEAQRLLEEGTEAGKREDFPQAVELLERAAALDPHLVDAHYNLAIGSRRLGRMPEAMAAMRRVIELSPDDFEARMGLGGWLAEAGKPGEALVHFERAAMIRMDSREAWLRLGQSYEAAGRYRDALGAYRRVQRLLDKEDPALLGVILRAAMRGQDGAAAVEAAGRLKHFTPGHGGFVLLGRALLVKGEASAAILELEKAVALAPASVPARLALAEAHAALGQTRSAADQLEQVVRLEPGEPGHYRLLSERYEEIGRLDLAIVAMRDGIAAAAAHSRALQAELLARLMLLYEVAGMVREAAQVGERMEALKSPDR